MTSPIQKNTTPLSSIFDPYVAGTTQAAATGILENGVEIATKYAKLSYGSSAAATGITTGSGASLKDLSQIFAALGTAHYPLGFNGGVYDTSANRGSAGVSLTMKSDGTWSISAGTGTPTSGTWLPAGDSVSSYTVMFAMSGFSSGAVPGGGTASYINGAPTQSALTTNRTCSCTASATTVNTSASNGGTVTVYLYKSGTLVSTSSCTFGADASGN
jgi:hypothetical protein